MAARSGDQEKLLSILKDGVNIDVSNMVSESSTNNYKYSMLDFPVQDTQCHLAQVQDETNRLS